jgi:ribonuclease HI
MSYLAEAHGLLPDNHFGGRKGQGTENALHAALETIHSGWKEGKVVSALLLDISGAFDNVSHDRLLHNLRTRRIAQAYTGWLSSFLRGRSTSLVLPEYTMPTRRVETGIPQGSSLSPILYIFYNADLMGRGAPDWGTDNIGYIDDTTMLATGDSERANCQRLREHYRRGCLRWAATHASRFEPSNFQLIHFHPPGRRARGGAEPPRSGPGEPLDLGDGQVVEASTTARLLGVILDQTLTFEAHLKHIDSAATRRLQAISALGGSKWGLRLRELRHVYMACITPIMLYAASVWYTPPVRGRMRFHGRQKKVLNRIQRRAGKLIAGAFRTVSGTAFNAELQLTPMPLLLRQRRIQTLIRIATTPAYRMHILDRRRHHQNPLLHTPLESAEEEVELATGVDPRDLEIRLPWAVPPWWEPPEVVIEATKERSLIHHDVHCIAYPEAIRVYTDGSGIHKRVGTAAVCLDPPICIQRYLGTDLEHTVPVAEVAGLVLALRLLKRDLVPRDVQRAPPPSRGSRKRAEIYSDNQGTLRTLLDPKQGSGQYLVRELVDLLDWLDPVLDISFHWLAAHEGVAGNELADQKAKEAAGWRQGLTDGQCGPLPPVTLPDHPTRGPLDAWIKQYTKEQWEEAWRQSEHGRHLQRFLPEVTRHSIAIYDDLTPVECSVLAQMRTGKIGLNHYLSTINRADDPLCPCGRAPETTHHVLFSCTRYDDLRRAAWPEGGPRDLTEALTEKQYVRRAARFMLNTGRLTYLAEATEPAWLEPSAPSSERLLTALAGDG